MKQLLVIFFFALGLQGATSSGSGYLVRRADGFVFVKQSSGDLIPFQSALNEPFPLDSSCSVRKASKLELVGLGKTLRFGEETNFTLRPDGVIEIHKGAILIYSRRQDIQIKIESPAASAVISGEGSIMIEVTANDGFKVVGLLGLMRIEETGLNASGSILTLASGELAFLKPLGNGFGDKLNIRLSRLCETAQLVSGYVNPTAFRNQLQAAIKAQDIRISRSFGLQVGDAPEVDRFETLPLDQP